MIGQRRQKLMQQVAVGAMNLKHIEIGFDRTQRCLTPILAQLLEVLQRQFVRHQPSVIHRDRTRRNDGPWLVTACMVFRRQCSVTVPWPLHARLPPRMSELNRRHRSIGAQKRSDALERRNLSVMPQTEVAMGDAPFGDHSRRLGHHDAGAALCELAEMNQMPVIGHAVLGRVLAHRRNHDPVLRRDAAQGNGREQTGL